MYNASGQVQKLIGQLTDPIDYHWTIGQTCYRINDWLGKTLRIAFLQKIHCVYCGRLTQKSFNQGYCYPCFTRLARCDLCIVKPEMCHFHKHTCREPEWGRQHCMQPHVLYLANTSGLKVGITRLTQIPTRWIDQGAIQAIPFFQVNTRRESGLLEDQVRQQVNDKTQWRQMLRNNMTPLDLLAIRAHLYAQIRPQIRQCMPELTPLYLQEASPIRLQYPMLAIPATIQSVNLEKIQQFEGVLTGIKGQYLIFDTGHVINVRALSGYQITLSTH